ncbi:uncharacterized protein EI97DRAFT_425181 [Westerdykella ornata]|uniref:P-loop containing nucleoside triphosphate hydrolase protein n=1 Tax=Westerdykella ornata TaxID=318751 RepID=A0A6A6JAL3_WESOR|nr:uncharacterized protein EI97DRAFT_425181 [Westerdykella ornata]KAF2273008.1 hypothetical protein EI97DRAFT_425181 [Westerdykella ornata]
MQEAPCSLMNEERQYDTGNSLPVFEQPDLPQGEDSLFIPETPVTSTESVAPQSTDIAMPPPNKQSSLPGQTPALFRFEWMRQVYRASNTAKGSGNTKSLPGRPIPVHAQLDNLPQNRSASLVHQPAAADNEEKEHTRALQSFEKTKGHYEALKLQNGGKLSFRHELEWRRIAEAEQIRLKKRQRDLQIMKEERGGSVDSSLFPNAVLLDEEGDGFYKDNIQGSGTSSTQSRKPDLPYKQPKRLSLAEAEYKSMLEGVEAWNDIPPSKKSKRNQPSEEEDGGGSSQAQSRSKKPRGKASHTTRPEPAANKKPTKRTRQSAKQKREKERQVKTVRSLYMSDVFKDQAAEDAPDQPTFTSRTKMEALKQLVASATPENQKQASADIKVLLNATKDFDGRGSVKADGNGLWTVKGMKTALKPYQVLGTAFMRRRERASEEPRGGLMADQMGLGKTLMMLANIVNGRPPLGEIKTTLLVASPSLLTQWEREIETHTNCGLKIMRYGTGTRLASNASAQVLAHFDIVTTTYGEILRSYPKNNPPIELQTAEDKISWWKEQWDKNRGLLHRVKFYRIVLDEAQAIKNHSSRTSIACRALMADHRWALSGTPVLNGLAELYPYFKFLQVPHTGSLKIFKNNYCDTNNPENAERLLLRLNQFMIRRTHQDVMFGAPILKLPKAEQATHWCDFNIVERKIYDIVKTRFSEKLNGLVKSGDFNKSYSNAMVMLLRLRQLTAHVLMLQFVMRDLLELEDIEGIRQVVEDFSKNGETSHTIIAIRKQLDDLNESKNGIIEGSSQDGVEDFSPDRDDYGNNPNLITSGKAFGKRYDFKPYLDSLTTGESYEKAKKRAKCHICHENRNKLWLTSCNHFHCEECYKKAAEGGDDVRITCGVEGCNQAFTHARECDGNGDRVDDHQRETRSARKSKERTRMDKEDLKDDWLSFSGQSVLPSAKTLAIKAQILNWITEKPDMKIIVYTQFLPMIRILARMCREEGWLAEQYHGKLSFPARDKAIARFADDPEVRVLLASLRCGGLGLNLTMASRVIMVDPWWNSAAEQQAFCRVFRIGQANPTFMTRFCVRNTVDERIISMQERKQAEIDEIMEDDGTRTKRLKLRDIMRLFGPVSEDSEGRPFILVHNSNPAGGFHADEDHEGYADEE